VRLKRDIVSKESISSAQAVASLRYRCMPRPRLDEGRYSIGAVQGGEIEAIREWRNAQTAWLRQAAPISPDAQRAYYAQQVWPEMASETPSKLLLSYYEDGRPIGYGGLVNIAWEHKRAEVSFLLRPDLADDAAGYATRFSAFLGLLRRLAFEDLGLERLFTETFEGRDAHMAILESSGFVREGVMRHHVRIDGRPVDSILHGCLASTIRQSAG